MTQDHTDVVRIYEQWHAAVTAKDLATLASLYAQDAAFESPLVWATSGEGRTGILRGRSDMIDFFAKGFDAPDNGLGRWYRTGQFFSNGQQLVWEYPRETPDGDQVDLIEVMDVMDGQIVLHKVYWGWLGFRTLATS